MGETRTDRPIHMSSGGGNVYLNLTEEDFVPDAVAADDPAADLGAFSPGGEVEQPALQGGVGLAEDLHGKT